METLSFAFGMLSMIAVALVTVVVIGIVKVIKMQKTINDLKLWSNNDSELTHRRIDNEINNLNSVINDDRKEMLSLHKESIDETIKVFKQVDKQLEDLNRYVDSRFDKMENKFNGASAKKQIINN